MRLTGRRQTEWLKEEFQTGLVPINDLIAYKMMLEDGCNDAPFSYKTERGTYRTVLRVQADCVLHVDPAQVRVTARGGLETLPMQVYVGGGA